MAGVVDTASSSGELRVKCEGAATLSKAKAKAATTGEADP
jgi:hypothetical protein